MLTAIGIANVLVLSALLVLFCAKRDNALSLIIAVGLLLRFFVSFLQDSYQIAPYVWDETTFYNMGLKMYQYFAGERFILPFTEFSVVPVYGSLLGGLFFFFDSNPIIARLVNSLVGGILIILIYRLAILLEVSRKASLLMAAIVAFTPSYILYSSLIMRDMLVWVLLLLVTLQWTKSILTYNGKHFVFGILIAIILIPFRPQYAPFITLIALIVIIGINRKRQFYLGDLKISGLKYVLYTLIVLMSIVVTFALLKNEIARWGSRSIIEYFSHQLAWRVQGGSSYLTGLEYQSLWDVIKYLPLRFWHFTFGPFIWSSDSTFVLLSALEALVGWYFVGMLIVNFKGFWLDNSEYKYAIFFIFTFSILGLLSSATMDSNYGTAMRHRMLFMPFIFISAMWAKNQLRSIVPLVM